MSLREYWKRTRATHVATRSAPSNLVVHHAMLVTHHHYQTLCRMNDSQGPTLDDIARCARILVPVTNICSVCMADLTAMIENGAAIEKVVNVSVGETT